MLAKYAKENGFSNTRFYVDDGITGTRFDRPGFQAMLDDIEMGYVSTVIVKDLSRLGRDYVTVGQYTDIYFPDHIDVYEVTGTSKNCKQQIKIHYNFVGYTKALPA